MKLYLFTLLALISSGMQSQDAKVIFEKATQQIAANNINLAIDVTDIDAKGRAKNKSFEIFLAEFDGVDKTKIVFTEPERAKGVTIIISDFLDQEEGLIEVLTPANGKIRKMKSTPENMALVGFNFFMTDYLTTSSEELTFTFLGEEIIGETPCYKIFVKAKDAEKGDGAELSVSKNNFRVQQVTLLNAENEPQSQIKFSGYKPVAGLEGKIYPLHIETNSLSSNTQSIVDIKLAEVIRKVVAEDFQLSK